MLTPTATDRISRWTPAIFACALGNFALAQALVAAGVRWAGVADLAAPTLAVVHLLTIGWITLLMFGALFQFVPVVTNSPLLSQRLSLGTLSFIELGLAGMVLGFFLLGSPLAALLPAGGSLVVIGILAGILNLAVPLARKRPLPLSARFIIAGLVLLFLTVSLGLAFALALTVPAAAQALGPMLANGVADHALAGLGGWFTLTAIGVSYELLPMFMLAPHERGAWGHAVFGTAILGFAAALLGGFESIKLFGQAAIGLAILLYLIDIARLYRDRKRRQIELHNQAAIGAFISLGIGLALALAAALSHGWTRAAPSLLFVVLFGWLSGLGLSQLYKIIPFLAWLARFGRRLGRGPVPRVQDLVNERSARYVFVAYFAAIAVGAAAAWLGLAPFLRGAIAVSLVATALLAREYRRAWRGHYAQTPRPAPVPGSPFHLPQP
ncbi:MAG: hypothetical protein K6U10_00290 [Acidobacteriia bacterium]|nr:hypothetical protein [Methyloceanibacter sp.]MCL6490241.1 hypothetical protein [Terriglobia bacterium]